MPSVSDLMVPTRCKSCEGACVKYGKVNDVQRYRCKGCGSQWVSTYKYSAYEPSTNKWIIGLNRECCGIRSIGRLLDISPTTVMERIMKLSKEVKKPLITKGRTYEVDELRTYLGNKDVEYWVCLAVDKQTGQVVDMSVGKRTKKMIARVIDTLLLAEAKKIYTDGLNIYKSLIPPKLHCVKRYRINKVERKNLDLRNSLKRLVRRGIGFSKSSAMLEASVKLCLWG